MKAGEFNRFLMEGGSIKGERNIIKSLSAPTVIKQSSSNLYNLIFIKLQNDFIQDFVWVKILFF